LFHNDYPVLSPSLLVDSLSSLCFSPPHHYPCAPHIFSLFPLLLTYSLSFLCSSDYSLSSLCSSPITSHLCVSPIPSLPSALLPLLITNSLSFLCSSTIPSLPSAPQLFPHIEKYDTKKKFKKQRNSSIKCKT
jgi:hypothetical protein